MPETQSTAPLVDAVTLHVTPYGDLRVLAKPNPTTGVLRCLVRNPSVTGIFTLEPDFDRDTVDPATTRLKVHYGDELPAGAHTGTYRPHRPLIHGTVRLVDYSVINAQDPGPHDIRIYHRDATTGHRRARVPAAVTRYVTEVLAALAGYWLQRPDLDRLRRAAARTLLRHIGLHRKLATIAELEALIAHRHRELDEQRAQLARMYELLAEEAPSGPTVDSTHAAHDAA
ncbi:hypothetical protein GCM10009733_103540 [Nonomuraea maheshkhaliensis]|uniref:Uncharacterized protein n=1 Tax=Nonomuraea maheshkhaliensis TaxID=419590 RepID=A0ABN2HN42_9ACTN